MTHKDIQKRATRLKGNPMVTNFISLVFLQGINYLLPLISIPYLFRTLEVAQFGLVNFGYAFTQYFIIFTDFGFNLSATKYISQHRNDPKEINNFLNSAMIGRMILCGISFLVLLILTFSFDKFHDNALFYLLYFGMVIGNVMFPMWFFQGMETMKYITVFNLLAKSISIIPFFFLIKQPQHYIYAPVCYSFGYILAGLFSLYFVYVRMKMKWFIPSLASIKTALKDSSTYFLSRASLSLFTTSNSFILGLVCGNVAVGYYSAAEKLYQAYNQLLLPFNGVLFPHIAKSHNVAFFKKTFRWISTVNVFTVLLALALSGLIISLVYDPQDNYSLEVFRILLCGCVVTIPSMLLGYPFLAAMGHPLYTNWTVMFTSCIHLLALLILYLTGTMSIYSVAAMVVFSECLLFSLRIHGIRKYSLFKDSGTLRR